KRDHYFFQNEIMEPPGPQMMITVTASLNKMCCYFRIKDDFHHEGDVDIGVFLPVHTYYTGNKVPHPNVPYYYNDMHLHYYKCLDCFCVSPSVEYNFKMYKLVLSLVFAIEEINKNIHLLPNISLGFNFYNLPSSERSTITYVLIWLTGLSIPVPSYNCVNKKTFAAAVTGTSSVKSGHIGKLLQVFKFPQLTVGPFDPYLSDKAQFPSLYQMVPRSTSLSLALVSLILRFGWTWVGLLVPEDHRGTQFLSDIREYMEKNQVCIAFVHMIPSTWNSFSSKYWKRLEMVHKSLANIIIIYGDNDSLQTLMQNLGKQIVTGKVWVMTSQWDVTNIADYFLLDSFHGSLIFSHHHEQMVEFKSFIQKVNPYRYPEDNYLPKLWFLFFKCSFSELDCHLLENCQPNASLDLLPRHIFDIEINEDSYSMYKAVYTVAHSVHEMMLHQVQMQPFRNAEERIFSPWQLHPFLRNIHMGDNMPLEWKQKLDDKYNILNFWNFPKGLGLKVKVGTFTPNAPQGQQLSLSEKMIWWPNKYSEIPQSVCSKSCEPGFRKVSLEGKPICCYDCTPCPDNEISNETDMDQCMQCPESHYAHTEKKHCLKKAVSYLDLKDPFGMSLTTIALCFSVLTAVVLGLFVKHRDTPIVKANNRALSYTLLITLTVCFLCSLLFIGHSNSITCILQQITYGGAFTVVLATVLAKAITVIIAFKVTFPSRLVRWLIISRAPNFIIPICTFFYLVLCGIWLQTSPPFLDKDIHSEHGYIILVCNKGSDFAFHGLLGYLCFLALGSYIVAFLSRNLPDTFNEAKFLSFSMLVFFCVWVTFLPVYHSTKGKVMVAMEVFSILVSSTALLGFIFVPKCYIILIRPERNSLHFIKKSGPFPGGWISFKQRVIIINNLLNLIHVCAYTSSECYFRIKEEFHHEGDVDIGVFLPVHAYYTGNKVPHPIVPYFYNDIYMQYNFKIYQLLLTMLFAIEEINKNPYLLPNISLGFTFHNAPYTERSALTNVLVWLTGLSIPVPSYNCVNKKNFTAIITGPSSVKSAHIGKLLQLFKFPQLTVGPFDPYLSDQAQFPSLYQMVPRSTSLSLALVSLIHHFDWTWVGLLVPEDHRGTQFLSDIGVHMEKYQICLAFVHMVPSTWNSFSPKYWKSLEIVQESFANIIIIYGDNDSLRGLMQNLGKEILTGKVWVMTSQWDVTNIADYFLLDSFHGSLIFSHHHEQMVEFKSFIQKVNPYRYPEDNYLPKLWFLFFRCSFSELDCHLLENCQINASLDLLPRHIFDIEINEDCYSMYKAVYTVAHSVHEMMLHQVQMQPFTNGKERMFFAWQLHPFLRNILMGVNMPLEWKHKLDDKYNILNFWNFPKGLGLIVKVGTFKPSAPQGQQLSLSEQMIWWPNKYSEIPQSVCSKSCEPGFRKVSLEGKPICCYDCTPCLDNEISNETDMDQCMQCPESHYANTEKKHCLKKAVSYLDLKDPFGMALTSIALSFSVLTVVVLGLFVKHRDTPIVKANNRTLSYTLLITLTVCFLCSLLFIGRPNSITCILQQITYGGAFTVMLATVLAKAMTVIIAFKVTFPRRLVRWLIISKAPNFIILICNLVYLILCGIWVQTSPPFLDKDIHSEHGYIILVCNKGSDFAFHGILGYLCFLALGSYVVAFLSRNLPDTFNEAKFLSFSMLVFFCVWATFLPVYHSTKGKVMVAMEVFSILVSSTALLGFIFVPKCYIILIRPDRNSRPFIKNKPHSTCNNPLKT
ncbi:vomeronasal type-2 receptor 116-like, partial [Sigmodon hispidus]